MDLSQPKDPRTALAYLDLAGGLSGDIFIGAMLSAGVEESRLTAILKALDLGPWRLEVKEVSVFGISARRVEFQTDPSPPHRTWGQIRDRILIPADLPGEVKELALEAFGRLARAEAEVHGADPEAVHFHEVGADDSVLDLVGAAACLHLAGIRELTASPVPLSRGLSSSAHGSLPLPAPATCELLKGRPVKGTGSPTELTTPTGAAILGWARSFGELPAMELTAVGAGVGQREPKTGLTRVFLGRVSAGEGFGLPAEEGVHPERVAVLSAAIDDMNPELYGSLMEDLLAAGALDVTLSHVQMKKNRPGTRLEVLAEPARARSLARLVLEETTTLGVRWRVEGRFCLERRTGTVEVEGVEISGKWVRRPSGRWEFRPEFDHCRRAAGKLERPVGLIYNQALAQAEGREPDR